jgi:hypothetical protein
VPHNLHGYPPCGTPAYIGWMSSISTGNDVHERDS